jgi:hypothetical protein
MLEELLRRRDVITDPLHTVASMLVDENVVGDQLQSIKLNYEDKLDSSSLSNLGISRCCSVCYVE